MHIASTETDFSGLPKHPWLASALPVDNSWGAVGVVAENAEDILEPEDFEGDPLWFSACVPIQWAKPSPSLFETVDEWNERLNSLRSMPPEAYSSNNPIHGFFRPDQDH